MSEMDQVDRPTNNPKLPKWDRLKMPLSIVGLALISVGVNGIFRPVSAQGPDLMGDRVVDQYALSETADTNTCILVLEDPTTGEQHLVSAPVEYRRLYPEGSLYYGTEETVYSTQR